MVIYADGQSKDEQIKAIEKDDKETQRLLCEVYMISEAETVGSCSWPGGRVFGDR